MSLDHHEQIPPPPVGCLIGLILCALSTLLAIRALLADKPVGAGTADAEIDWPAQRRISEQQGQINGLREENERLRSALRCLVRDVIAVKKDYHPDALTNWGEVNVSLDRAEALTRRGSGAMAHLDPSADPVELCPPAGLNPVAEGPIPDGQVSGQLTLEEVAEMAKAEGRRLEALGPGSSLSEGLLWKGYRNTEPGG